MSHETITKQKIFEQNNRIDFEAHPPLAGAVAALVLQISELTQNFANVERIPRYQNGERENDAEHSFMLALAAPEVARILGLDLNMEKVMAFALCHDLIELKTGDIPTFNLTPEELTQKEQREYIAKQQLLRELPPGIAAYLQEYEEQATDEAVFIRTLDKLLPVAVDIQGEGRRVMREDYGVTTHLQAKLAHTALHERITKKFGEHCPELIGAHAVLCAEFVAQYSNET